MASPIAKGNKMHDINTSLPSIAYENTKNVGYTSTMTKYLPQRNIETVNLAGKLQANVSHQVESSGLPAL